MQIYSIFGTFWWYCPICCYIYQSIMIAKKDVKKDLLRIIHDTSSTSHMTIM